MADFIRVCVCVCVLYVDLCRLIIFGPGFPDFFILKWSGVTGGAIQGRWR